MTNEMTVLLFTLTSERFTLTKFTTKQLKAQLCVYFNVTGITNDLFLGMLMEHSSWTVPNSLFSDEQSFEQLMVPVSLLFVKIVTYIVLLYKKSLHLST